MLKKALKITGHIAVSIVEVVLDDSSNDHKDDQLDQLSDGLGNYITDDESYTDEEITAAKSRGELYDTYL